MEHFKNLFTLLLIPTESCTFFGTKSKAIGAGFFFGRFILNINGKVIFCFWNRLIILIIKYVDVYNKVNILIKRWSRFFLAIAENPERFCLRRKNFLKPKIHNLTSVIISSSIFWGTTADIAHKNISPK